MHSGDRDAPESSPRRQERPPQARAAKDRE